MEMLQSVFVYPWITIIKRKGFSWIHYSVSHIIINIAIISSEFYCLVQNILTYRWIETDKRNKMELFLVWYRFKPIKNSFRISPLI